MAWRDYVGLVPSGIAVLNGAIAVAVAQFPLKDARDKWTLVTAILVLGLFAIVANVWSNNITLQRKAEEQAQQAAAQAQRRAVREQLGTFIDEGTALQRLCTNEQEPAPEQQANEWAGRVEAYLTANLGASYVTRFRSSAGLPVGMNAIVSIPHRNLWSGIRTRLARLEQFSQEMPQ